MKCLLYQIVTLVGLEGEGGHLYSTLRSNRFPNVKKVPSSGRTTLEESLFSIHNSRGVSENLLAFGGFH